MDEMHKTRTDVHRPSALVTEDYDYLFAFDNKVPWARDLVQTESGREFLRSLRNYDPATADRDTHQCHHCGAHIRYGAFLKHRPTGRTICVGETCLDNRFGRATADFHKLRKAAELDRQQQRIKKAREAFVEANPDLAWMNEANAEAMPEASRGNAFIHDVARKLRIYGDLSERQIAAVRKAVERDAQRFAEREVETWVPIPDNVAGQRVEVTGTILATKWIENDFGSTEKMLLKVDHGDGAYKLWLTVPSKARAGKGDTITVKVKVERSHDDEAFGFGSRPTFISEKLAA